MNKIWLPFVLLVSILNSYGQVNNSVEEILRDRLQNYCAAVPWEEIYIHADRGEYISGEDMWMAVYLFDRQKNMLADYNSVAYIEILNSNNISVLKKKISINKGTGPAHFVLPDTLSTGSYIIRAYTSWMKNFLPNNCFTMEVGIYNALKGNSTKVLTKTWPVRRSIAETTLPDSDTGSGINLKVNNLKTDKLEISLITDERYLSASKNYFVLIQTHGIVNLVKRISLERDTMFITLPKEVLLSGVNQIIVFTENLKPLCERLIYTPHKETVDISLKNSDSFRPREKVNTDFGLGAEQLLYSDISISVASSADSFFKPDIDEYLLFGTEFGKLPGYLSNKHLNEIKPEVIDSFLVNTKSYWINWSSVISGKYPKMKYEMERDNNILSGRLVNKNTRTPEPGKYLFLSRPGKIAGFQYSRTDSAGNFSFTLPVSELNMDLVIQPEVADENQSVMILPSFSEDLYGNYEKHDTSYHVIPGYIAKWAVNYQVNKIYGIKFAGDPVRNPGTIEKSFRFYGKPDIELKMDDYIKLPVMEEVFFELIPGVLLKKMKNEYSITIYDPVSKRPYEKPPVIMIDGVVITDAGIVAAMDPENVEKIDVVKDLYLVGDYIFFGIVNIITRAGNCSNITLPDYVIRMNYRVVDSVETFLSPVYDSEESKRSRIPDFRNTLYWNPFVKSDNNGKTSIEFWTSDGAGSYEICLQGVNQKGEPVSSRRRITVIP